MKNLTWQNPEQLFVAQELINKVKSKCCGIKDKYYQISNRIAFHLKIKEMIPNEKINNVKLVFLNFVNDPDWMSVGKHASSNDWEKKYNTIFNEMGVTKEQFTENEVFIWNVDASRLKR